MLETVMRFLQIRNEKSDICMKKDNAAKPSSQSKKKSGPSTAVKPNKKDRKLYTVTFFHNWCKSCGLCSALCVKKIIKTDVTGLPYIDEMDMDVCTGCRFCEIHCPDFAITIGDKHPERRRSNGH